MIYLPQALYWSCQIQTSVDQGGVEFGVEYSTTGGNINEAIVNTLALIPAGYELVSITLSPSED